MGAAVPAVNRIADALFSETLQGVLGLTFGRWDRSWSSTEVISHVGRGTGSTHRVLTRLAEAGILSVEWRGNQKLYRADPECPVFPELRGLIEKTVGLVGVLREILDPLADRIDVSFVFGSVASGDERSGSDVDVVVLSDTLAYPDLFEVLPAAEERLRRPIQPHLSTKVEWKAQQQEERNFTTRVTTRPKLFVIGSEDDLG